MTLPNDSKSKSLVTELSGPTTPPNYAYVVDRPDDDSEAIDPGQGVNVHVVLNALRRWWPVCLGSGLVLAAIAGALAWYTFQPVYRATGWLRIESSSPYLVYQLGSGPNSGIDDRFVRTQLALLRSPIVLDRVLERPDVALLTEIQDMPNPVSTLSDKIRASSEDNSELYKISYASNSAKNAALIVNTVLEEFVTVQKSVVGERSDGVIALLKAEAEYRQVNIAGLRAKIIGLGGTLSDGEHGTTRPDAEVEEMDRWMRQLADCETECLVLESNIKVLEQQLASVKETGIDEAAIERMVKSNSAIVEAEGLVKELELDYERAVESLRQKYQIPTDDAGQAVKSDSGNSPEKRALPKSIWLRLRQRRQAIEDGQDKLVKMREQARSHAATALAERQQGDVARKLHDARISLDSQKSLKSSLATRISSQTSNTSDTDTAQLEFAIRDLQRAEGVYDRLMERVNRLETERRAPLRVTVLKPADVPADPLESSPLKRVAVVALAVFCIPFGLVLLREAIAQPIGSAEQLPTHQNVPLFAEIPSLPGRVKSPSRHFSRAYERSRAAFENSVHYLCRSLMLGQMDSNFRVLAVTSSVSGEGKTSLSGAIAASMVRCSHEPVLLVDADLRKPSAHLLFELPVTTGLADVLTGDCTLDEALIETSVKNVWLLPAGQAKAHPHALLRQSEFGKLMAEIRERFSLTILDTSPALSVGESLSVCNAADGVLLCAMRDVTRRNQIKRACDRLRLAGIVPMGIVLGGIDSHGYEVRHGAYYHDEEPVAQPTTDDDDGAGVPKRAK